MWEVNRKQLSALAIDQGLYRVLCSIKILITNQSNLIWPDKFSFAYLFFQSDVPERNYSSDFFYGHSTCPSAMFFSGEDRLAHLFCPPQWSWARITGPRGSGPGTDTADSLGGICSRLLLALNVASMTPVPAAVIVPGPS